VELSFRKTTVTEQSNREKEIFEGALDHAPGEEQQRYLEVACGTDAVLLARIQALLRANDAGEDFLPEVPKEKSTVVTEKPGDQIGRYRLLEKIGEGGCGVVYMAEQSEPLRRRVALKIIKLGMDTKSVIARFEAERQALALMDHPNIAKVLDEGATSTGRPYFVMELVEGIKITDYCDQNNLTTRQRLDLFIQVCRAIQHAHQKGVIHRDIKPSNVLVATQDGVPVPKVIDFGIAKATQGRLTDMTVFTAFEQFLGTPAYMSPEQAQLGSLDVDTRSDIYSLGVLLYELLTGKTPFDSKELLASGLDAMRRTIQEKEPPTPSTRVKQQVAAQSGSSEKSALQTPKSGIDKDLDWVVMKCLEKDRRRRYETANGLVRDIERHLNNEAVAAGPPSKLYRFQKLVRRNRLSFILGSSVGATMIIGLVVSIWQWQRLNAKTTELQIALAESELIGKAVSISPVVSSITTDKDTKIFLVERDGDKIQIGEMTEIMEVSGSETNQQFEKATGEDHKVSLTNSTEAAAQGVSGTPSKLTSTHRSADGRLEAFAYSDGTALIRDARTGILAMPVLRHPLPVNAVRFSPDCTKLATGSSDGAVRIWDVRNGRLSLGPLSVDGTAVVGLHFTEDSRNIVALTVRNSLWVWDASTGQLRKHRVVEVASPAIHFTR
jgi:serine/threonine protein kinase